MSASGAARLPEPRRSPARKLALDLDAIDHLPALPEVVTQILNMIDDPQISAQRVGDVVGQDQSMVASILRLVNSPFFGLSRRITSIQHAVVLLGFRTVRNLALSAVLVKTFGDRSRDARLDRALLWRHTVACATGARLLARKLRTIDPEEAFLAGLVHEIGLLIMDQYYHRPFCEVLDLVFEEGWTQRAAEAEVFGKDHAAVGRMLAHRWNFPPGVTEAIACHHEPGRAKRDPALAAVVHAAAYLDLAQGDGDPDAPEEVELGVAAGDPVEPAASADGPPADGADSADADPERAHQIWETETLDDSAFGIAGIDEAVLAAVRSEFAREWEKARVFVSLLS